MLRTSRFTLLSLALISCVAVVIYVNAQNDTPPLPAKDPTAVSILNRAAAAMGANFLQNAADTQAAGSLTLLAPDGRSSIGTITLLTRGADAYRTEITEGGSLRSVTVGEGAAWFEKDGQIRGLSSETVREMRPEHLPQLSKWKVSGSPAVGVRYLGAETLEGSSIPAHVIELEDTSPGGQKNLSSQGSPDFQLPGNTYRLYIDSSSFLVRKAAFTRGAEGNPTARSVVENLYSDYRQFGPAAVPFRIERRVSGRVASVISLSEFKINTGVGPGRFAKPFLAEQGGGQ